MVSKEVRGYKVGKVLVELAKHNMSPITEEEFEDPKFTSIHYIKGSYNNLRPVIQYPGGSYHAYMDLLNEYYDALQALIDNYETEKEAECWAIVSEAFKKILIDNDELFIYKKVCPKFIKKLEKQWRFSHENI